MDTESSKRMASARGVGRGLLMVGLIMVVIGQSAHVPYLIAAGLCAVGAGLCLPKAVAAGMGQHRPSTEAEPFARADAIDPELLGLYTLVEPDEKCVAHG